MLHIRFFIVAVLSVFAVITTQAQTPIDSAFTYQGELAAAGTPATGMHDLRFRLYEAAAGGTQVGSELCSDNLEVANGRFTVSLDFGAVFAGQKRFLEIEVRQDTGLDCSDASGFTILAPRQELTATPNASFAQAAASATTASNAASLNGQPASFFQNASNLTGTLADARLSSNIARLNGNQTFTGLLNLTNAGNTFVGNGAGLTSLNGANIISGTVARPALSADVQSGLGRLTTELSLAGSVATGSDPLSVAVSGSFAYVVATSANRLQVFDISNPGSPTLLGSIATGSSPRSVAVSGSFAYVVNHNSNTLQVFNISNPVVPTSVGTVATGLNPMCVAVSGLYAYVVNASSNTLQVFSISNPALPTQVGGVATGSGPFSIAVSGSFAYVVNQNAFTLQVFNISNPAAPASAGIVATGDTPYAVAVAGSYAYVVNTNSRTLQVFNVANPVAPVLAGSVSTLISPISVAVSGSLAYVPAIFSNTLEVFNVGNPAAPTLVGSIGAGISPRSVSVSGSTVYVVNQSSSTLQVFNAPPRIGFGTPLASTSLTGVSGAGLTDLSASGITTGTIANARTTGTSLNTPSTLVLRDGSGNFSAGTITAASFAGNGAALTNLSASGIASGNLNAARLPSGGAWALTSALNIDSNALVVDALTSYVGVGTASPSTPLHVTSSNPVVATVTSSSTTGTWFNLHNTTASTYWRLLSTGSANGEGVDKLVIGYGATFNGNAALMTFTDTGRVGINTSVPDQRLSVNGNASKSGGGSWATFSDARLKHDVAPLEGTLDKLLQLRGVSFYYNNPASINELGGQRIGMIAQEVERVFPDWVELTSRGYKSLTFRGFEALTVEALRELRAEKDAQIAQQRARFETELSKRDAEIDDLKARLERLEMPLGVKP